MANLQRQTPKRFMRTLGDWLNRGVKENLDHERDLFANFGMKITNTWTLITVQEIKKSCIGLYLGVLH